MSYELRKGLKNILWGLIWSGMPLMMSVSMYAIGDHFSGTCWGILCMVLFYKESTKN